MKHILLLPGDGVGREITAQATKVLEHLNMHHNLNAVLSEGLIGGAAYDAVGTPLPVETITQATRSDAILLGAVGGSQWENLDRELRPEKGLLGLRSHFDLFANLRPALLYDELADSSTLKPEIVAGLDLMIVRELVAGIYFGMPRGIEVKNKERYGYNTASYTESQIRRIAHCAFTIAAKRHKKLCSVDKANVLEVSELWREIMIEVATEYPAVELSHMYVDNAAMQLVANPKQFDTIVTTNMFGDILSDCAAELTGSIGMLPSASLNADNFGMYEPIHGSAPDIAGQNIANPIATILSVAMMCKYSLEREDLAILIDNSVKKVLSKGYRTTDIAYKQGDKIVSTSEMGDLITQHL